LGSVGIGIETNGVLCRSKPVLPEKDKLVLGATAACILLGYEDMNVGRFIIEEEVYQRHFSAKKSFIAVGIAAVNENFKLVAYVRLLLS
jgi:glutamate 5-kinase